MTILPAWPFWLAWYAPGEPWEGGLLSAGGLAGCPDSGDWWDGVHPQDWSTFRLSLKDPLEGREPDGRRLLFRWQDREGGWRWLQGQVAAAPAEWGPGWSGRWLVGASDAKELGGDRRAELEASRFRRALEHLPVLVSAFGAGNSLEFWNREAERVTGWSRDAIRAEGAFRDPMELVYPDAGYRQQVYQEWALRGSSYRDWELELTCRSGEKRIIAWSSVADEVPIPGWDSWSVGVDVTARVRAQEAMQRLMLGVAHEVRSPLFALSSMAEALRARHPADERLQRTTTAMLQEVGRMQKLMEDLLSFGRPLAIDPMPILVREFLHEVGAHCAPTYAELEVELDLQHEEEGRRELDADPLRLHQLLRNLLENAAQHAARGGRRVQLRSVLDAAGWTCTVEDEGPGIPSEVLPRIFEPFFSSREGGLGLGLAIAWRFAQTLGGTLEAENRAEGGARFRFRLPAEEAP